MTKSEARNMFGGQMVVKSVNEKQSVVTAYTSDNQGNTQLLGKEYMTQSDSYGQQRVATDRDGLVTGTVFVSNNINNNFKKSQAEMMHDTGHFHPDGNTPNTRYSLSMVKM